MVFKVVGTYKSALTRQVSESVRIRGRGESVLNSRSEYDRCRIHRLTIEGNEIPKCAPQMGNGGEVPHNQGESEGEQYLLQKRRQKDKLVTGTGTHSSLTSGQKRGIVYDSGDTGKAPKRRKYVLVGVEWGTQPTQGLNCRTENNGEVGTKWSAGPLKKLNAYSRRNNDGDQSREKL